MSDIKVGDRVRRTKPCFFHVCNDDFHQVGWEGEVTSTSSDGLHLRFGGVRSGRTDAYRKVEPEDERIAAWETIISHPIFKECFNTEGTLLDAVRNRLVELYEMEQTINELKVGDDVTTEAQPYLSAAPDPAIRLKALELALDYGFGSPKEAVKAAKVFAAWVEGR